MNRYLVPLIAFVILMAILKVALDPDRNLNDLPSPLLQKPAPEFDLPSLMDDTKRVSLESFGNKMALVNVWAPGASVVVRNMAFLTSWLRLA